MTAPRALTLAAVMGLVAAGCGGGGEKASTPSSGPPSSEATTTTLPTTTTTTAAGPDLEKLVLVKADVPGFKVQAEDPDDKAGDDESDICDDTTTPALAELDDGPSADGKTFERGTPIPVEVSSFATRTTPEKAEAALKELLDAKVRECLETDVRTSVEKDLPAGVTVTIKVTSAPATLNGLDQAAVLSATGSAKGPGGTQTFRFDLVFLRLGGTILGISYGGAGALASTAERQRIVAVAVKKLTGTTSGTSTTTGAGANTSSTSLTSTTARRATTTTRQGGGTTSTTR